MLPFSAHHIAHQAVNSALNGVVVGIPMVVAAQQRSRRNSLASAPLSIQHPQRCAHVMRASLDDRNGNDRSNDEELRRTHTELFELEQQMLLMMGQGETGGQSADGLANDDDAMSVGSFGSSSDLLGFDPSMGDNNHNQARDTDARENNRQLHQDLTHYSSSFTNSSQKRIHPNALIDDHTQCYVILFGMGSEETEGIYTLRTVEACDEGDIINVDTVVAFEDEVDAQRFATLLEASLRHQPAVYSTTWGDITEWSMENAARCRLEPSGSLLLPPESNVSVTDWERALALQRGQYTVLDEEPEVARGHSSSPLSSLHDQPLSPSEEAELFCMDEVAFDGKLEPDNVSNIVDSRMAKSSLNSVREELERLLGSSS